MEERRKGTGDLLLPPEPRFQMSVGKGGQKKKNGEKLGRRVSEAEREGIGCLLGASGSQNLQSSAADFLSDSLSLIFFKFIFVQNRCLRY